MNSKSLKSLTGLVLGILLTTIASAGEKGKGRNGSPSGDAIKSPAPVAKSASVSAKEPFIGVKVVISPSERDIIRSYVTSYKANKKAKALPPGLARKVARGGDLPPGWQKKCVRGEILPAAVYRHCHPLPAEVVVKLPPPPPGTILVTVEGKVVRLARATLEILDVFEVL